MVQRGARNVRSAQARRGAAAARRGCKACVARLQNVCGAVWLLSMRGVAWLRGGAHEDEVDEDPRAEVMNGVGHIARDQHARAAAVEHVTAHADVAIYEEHDAKRRVEPACGHMRGHVGVAWGSHDAKRRGCVWSQEGHMGGCVWSQE
eukprot:773514-Prymnesium_polylepis.1